MKKYSICFFLILVFCFSLIAFEYRAPEMPEETVIFREWTAPETHAWVKASLPNEPLAAEATVSSTEEETLTSAPMFWIVLTDEGILVYHPDERTIYKKIPILPEDLSESDQKELADGISVPDEEELYHYLESITS